MQAGHSPKDTVTTGHGDPVLQVEALRTYCYTRWGVVKAVDGVSFDLRQGETLGIVGESGCGKSMTALSLLRLVPRPVARIVAGRVLLNGENLLEKSEREMRYVRGRRLSMILQDPQTSLNPVFTVGDQLLEAIQIHHRG
ncbi:MAG: ATP-binding cassette domain-containing protein, partial [Candidatus Tectomicrobia bacterium]|nr:ATP-binding cassette domain-containing protein [Candidatus Tectomicrobia bacterium]